MKSVKCLLVDDEPPAIDLLLNYSGMVELLDVVGTSNSAVKAFDLLQREQVDLLFLDIQMPVLNGIDFIKSLRNPPAIVLTTAYRKYALDGYDLDIIDYLLKPISFDRFLKAIDRYRERMGKFEAQLPTVQPKTEVIFCNVNRTMHKIVLNDILYIESLKDYVRVHTIDNSLVVKGNLGSFLKKLPPENFIRIHRSFAIAKQYIQSFNQSEVTINNQTLPIGLSHRVGFVEAMKDYY